MTREEDCISRQAVEDAIAETIVNGESLGYAVAYDILYDLPSVTPQQEPILNEIRAEIERQEKWLWQAGIKPYNVDIAFSSIKSVLAESDDKDK